MSAMPIGQKNRRFSMKQYIKRLISGILTAAMILSVFYITGTEIFADENTEEYSIGTEEFRLTYTASEEGSLKKVGDYSQTKMTGSVYLISLPAGSQLKSANALNPENGYQCAYTFKGDKYNVTSGHKTEYDGDVYLPADNEYITDGLFRTYPQMFYARVYKNTTWSDGFELPAKDVKGTIIELYYRPNENYIYNTYIIQIAQEKTPAFWDGDGTKDKPYILRTPEDLKRLSETTNNDGESHIGEYFIFENDITLPDEWTPIGTKDSRFSGNIDGNGNTLTVPSGSLSLIGTPSDAAVKNLKLYGEKIPGYGLVQVYTTQASIDIDNVTILSGSHILYSGFIGGYGNTSVNIRNSRIEKGVTIGDDSSGFWGDLGDTEYNYAYVGVFDHRDNIGSFAGAFNGTILNCVSYATVYGRNNVGGIVGMKGQSMHDMYINSCGFYGEIVSVGNNVGGIVGSGYPSASAPNSPCVTIQNCFSSGNITGAGNVGGIFGGEPTVTCCWANGIGRIQNNLFTGTVKSTDKDSYAGGIIGYMMSLDRYNIIENNFYLAESSGQGIGGVSKVDTDCETADKSDINITYVTTSQYARNDDPLGKDADNLTKAVSAEDLKDGKITGLLNNGENSLKNWIQGTDTPEHSKEPVAYKLTIAGDFRDTYYIGEELDISGLSFTAYFSDGSKAFPTADELQITGYDKNSRGIQNITFLLGAASAEIQVKVLKPAGEDITVTVSLFGDRIHPDGESDIHTMAAENLENWVNETSYTVSNNSTVWDVIKLLLEDNNMTCSNPTGNYIESITKNGEVLEQFSNGTNSGWLYSLNGEYPELGVSEQYLEDGDIIILHYTDDYIKEQIFAENKKTAEETVNIIDSIGEVSIESAKKIISAEKAYEALSDEEKIFVKNYGILLDAKQKYIDIVNSYGTAESAEKIYGLTGGYISSLGIPAVGSVGGEWAVLGLARAEFSVAENYYNDYYKNVLEYVEAKINENEQLHRVKSTDNSRVILALTAAGFDVTNAGGHNLLKGLSDIDYIKKQGINGPIWALIALDSHNYDIPEASAGKTQASRENLIDTILGYQLEDGGWSLFGENADPDMTSMAITALSPYYSKIDRVTAAVEKAVAALSEIQLFDGSFGSVDGSCAESTAQVVTALTSIGIDPDTDPRFIKNERSVLDALCFYSENDGGFRHLPDGASDGMATEQGYYALAAYFRFKDGKTGLYDMSDVQIRGADDGSNKPENTEKPPVSEEENKPEASDGSQETVNKPQLTPDNTSDNGINAYIGFLALAVSAVIITNLKRKQI